MSFQQGLSGLNGASKMLETLGNNIANANTAGFKQSNVQFSDVYATAFAGSVSGQVGIGTKVSQVSQQFGQGNITSTSNSMDLAINGGGFFRLNDNGAIVYSRNGQFNLDKDGHVVNASGAHLTGYAVDPTTGKIASGAPSDIVINTADLKPSATSTVKAQLNLNSQATTLTPALFDPTKPDTYSNATSVNVYDSLGNTIVLQTYYVKTGANSWNVYATGGGTLTPATTPATPVAQITFDSKGALATQAYVDPATGVANPALKPTVNVPLPATSAAAPLSVTLDFNDKNMQTTQFGAPFSVNALNQDGYTSGRLAGFTTGADGLITGRYTNGKNALLGQVVLANFTNPNGLQPLGNNAWAETPTSGVPLVGAPETGSLGTLQASAVEDSNVDLTAELVAMITAQRVYQANAQTIKTQDQVLQTIVNLR
ncbi:flagellar hook protein FlgE [Noviherbaspirillum humi]|uniref:Flagellar hook protein FlgE n=1 Tax=Noviherbaspirillum humi TaxID=1688639 RepID=A0A239FV33_9BURK|nr:flagellar hook protein FlgE [Noviherbaspirillum humi]SNS60996.1 flagellar hook protein FlgE [Noviherbaspirillum humi]